MNYVTPKVALLLLNESKVKRLRYGGNIAHQKCS